MAAGEGDLLCVLWGCSVPLVLRIEGDHHVLVGECYAYGIMDGEAAIMVAQDILKEEIFVLH
jgi:hypothetical protein